MKMKPVHPGEILVEEFLVPMGISQYRLAKEIHVPLRRVNEIARDLPRGVLDSISQTPASVAFCFRDRQLDQARA